MTQTELDKMRALYDPALQRTAQTWDRRQLPQDYPPPPVTLWHYETQGKEFVIVMCGADDLRAFTLVDLQGLKDYLGPPATATRRP